ncbi:Zn-dependent hydrolases of the beta-lactamase fold-like protein [Candidatus Vecturithrix granuli]|uniref:Zn-dependent hydrolases of the beta-lactamase fold-like protein n=1 Tax=Vecturithrix granuli TaxID=1499967 RepID=A0A081BYQ0_VECG1|nr:Zn-dependent hydrolases of the beta-lactamase fold-like protein [Candidatus Vecturithrix granuli]
MIQKIEEKYASHLKESLCQPLPDWKSIALWWLGQAGFAVKYGDILVFIDPYLSDLLAKKYQGREFPHIRMMNAPILPEEVTNLDFLLCSHKHSDHTDPETLPIVAQNNPKCVFIAPRAEAEWVAQLVGSVRRVRSLNAGERIELAPEITLEAIPAAHEELQVNARGEHAFLGYILKLGEITLYHSGDCTPYPGLEDILAAYTIDLALLPVNGRDEYRRSRGILGNFTLTEAVNLCQHANIPFLLGHHFGMFEFNTINREQAEHDLQQLRGDRQYCLVENGVKYLFSR